MSFSPDYLGTAPSNASAVTARRITSSPDHRETGLAVLLIAIYTELQIAASPHRLITLTP